MLFTPFANCQADWNCTFRIAGTQSSVVHGYRHCSALHSHWIHETWLLHLLLASQLPAVSLLAAKKTLGGNAYSNSADVTANLLGPSRKLETLHSCTCLLLCPYEPLGMMLLSVHYAEYGGSVWKALKGHRLYFGDQKWPWASYASSLVERNKRAEVSSPQSHSLEPSFPKPCSAFHGE